MTDLLTKDIAEEAGKRRPYESVTVGLCKDFQVAAAPNALCAAFRLVTPMAGDNGDVVLPQDQLEKALRNGMGEKISGYHQALGMMRDFKR